MPRHARAREFQDRWYGRAFIILTTLTVLALLAWRLGDNLFASFGA